MRSKITAALTLVAASSVNAQTTPPTASSAVPSVAPPAPAPDFSTATPIAGDWTYSSANGVSQASFVNSLRQPQLTIRCTIATRRMTISKPATGAAPFLDIWTSEQTRELPSSFLPSSGTLSAELSAYDPFADAIAFSRGRIVVSVPGQPALVIPNWPEAARVIEDCRA